MVFYNSCFFFFIFTPLSHSLLHLSTQIENCRHSAGKLDILCFLASGFSFTGDPDILCQLSLWLLHKPPSTQPQFIEKNIDECCRIQFIGLAYFKYFNFGVDSFNTVLNLMGFKETPSLNIIFANRNILLYLSIYELCHRCLQKRRRARIQLY